MRVLRVVLIEQASESRIIAILRESDGRVVRGSKGVEACSIEARRGEDVS